MTQKEYYDTFTNEYKKDLKKAWEEKNLDEISKKYNLKKPTIMNDITCCRTYGF